MVDPASLQPVVSPSPDAEPFWTALAAHRIVLPRCGCCASAFFYPRVLCPACGSRDITWFEAAGTGTLHSFCQVHRTSVPGLSAAVPFTTGLVDLDEGPRLLGFLLGFPADPEAIHCGVPVRAEFLDLRDGHTLLAFRPSGG